MQRVATAVTMDGKGAKITEAMAGDACVVMGRGRDRG